MTQRASCGDNASIHTRSVAYRVSFRADRFLANSESPWCEADAGTHFRFGTISWRPDLTPLTDGAGSPWAENQCDFSPDGSTAHRCPVNFSFKAAYRKDYEWGRFFREQWRASEADGWQDGGSCYLTSSCSATNVGVAWLPYYQTFEGSHDYTGYQIRLSVRASLLPLTPFACPLP